MSKQESEDEASSSGEYVENTEQPERKTNSKHKLEEESSDESDFQSKEPTSKPLESPTDENTNSEVKEEASSTRSSIDSKSGRSEASADKQRSNHFLC